MTRSRAEIDSGKDNRTNPFTPEELDAARSLLGRRQYTSVAAKEIAKKCKIGVDRAYNLIHAVREATIKELAAREGADDPLTTQYLFLLSIVADGKEGTRDRLAASQTIIKLLRLDKFLSNMAGDDVQDFLGELAARHAARKLEAKETG